MEDRRRKLVVFLLAAPALALALRSPFAAHAAGLRQHDDGHDGAADGTLTVNGTTYSLKYAYASAQPGFFDKSKEDIRVLLSDLPLTDDQRADVFEIIRLANDGKAHVVEVVLDADQKPIAGSFFTKPFEGMVSATGMHLFEPQTFEHKRIAGRLHTDGARTFQDVTYEYTATFAAAIPRSPTPEEVAAALASPAGRTAAALVAAIHEDNFAAFVALLADPAASAFRAGGAAAFAALKGDTRPDSKVVGLTRPSESTAIATINGTRDGIVIETIVELASIGGEWKVVKLQ
jgi:hypothetical protein